MASGIIQNWGFAPSGDPPVQISVTSVSNAIALPSNALSVALFNVGSATAYIAMDKVSTVSATVLGIPIPAGGSIGLSIGNNSYIAAITQSGTALVNVVGGYGIYTPVASSGSSGSGTITGVIAGTGLTGGGTSGTVTLNATGSAALAIGATISGGTPTTLLYETSGGALGNVTLGANLALSGSGTLSATAGSGITTVTAGTGLTGGGSTSTVTLSMPTFGSAGSYTNASITVDAEGRVTSASSGSGSGGLTSVGLTMPTGFTVGGSPLTSNGTLAVNFATGQTANQFLATPNGSTGALAIRAIVPADLPVATTGALGAVRPDGSTITISGGVISAVTGGSGTVSSVGLTMPSIFSVAGSPVTGSSSITVSLANEAVNTFFAGPASGGSVPPTFRAIAAADLPLATSGAFGAVKPDGTTVTVSAGVLSAPTTIGNAITGGTSGYFLWDNAGALAVGSFGSGLSFNTSTGVLTSPNTPPVQTVTTRYTTGGTTTLAITDNFSLINTNSGTTSTYTLPNDSVDGHAHTVKRFGPGNVVVNALIDGVSQSITMNTSGTVKESIVLIWDATEATYLYVSGD